ncbi:MAG: hypothetical protein ACP6IQ_03965 [Candidatus Njordarchaeia archaeon]|nr:hypothetical protein [Candidatus Korarchaeota archaeon]
MSSLNEILQKALDKTLPLDEREEELRKIVSFDNTVLTHGLIGVLRTFNKLCQIITNDPDELPILKQLTSVLGELTLIIPQKSSNIIDYVLDTIEKYPYIEQEILTEILDLLILATKSVPETIFKLKDLLAKILKGDYSIDAKIKALNLLGNVAWNLPFAIRDFSDILRKLLFDETVDMSLKEAALETLSKVGKRNFFVIKSFLEEVISKLDIRNNLLTVRLLSALSIPAKYKDLVEKLFTELTSILLSHRDPKFRLYAAISLAKLVRRKDFASLQMRLTDIFLEVLDTEDDLFVRKNVIEAISIPVWASAHYVIPLTRKLTDILFDATEDEDLGLTTANTLYRLALMISDIVGDVTEAFIHLIRETQLSEKIKAEVLNLIPTLVKINRALAEDFIITLIDLMGRPEESDFVKTRAAEILEDLSKIFGDILWNNSWLLVDLWRRSTNWGIKDSIVRAVGEILRSHGIEDKEELFNILIEALVDPYIYKVAINYISLLSLRYPQHVADRVDDIFVFLRTIKELERETGGYESASEEYYMYVETPLIEFIRLLTHIIKERPDKARKIASVLINLLSEESNEIIIREIAYGLSVAHSMDPDIQPLIMNANLDEKKLGALRNFGLEI